MSITFYGDLRFGFSVVMSVHYSFKSDADLIRRISPPLMSYIIHNFLEYCIYYEI